MTKLERVNKVYKWLFFKGVGANQQEMAKAMNVDSSYLSQVLNGKLTLTNKFIRALCSLDDNLNSDWIIEGEGNMFIHPENENIPERDKGYSMSVDVRYDRLIHLIERSEERIDETNKMINTLSETLKNITESYDKHIGELIKNRESVQAEHTHLLAMLEQNQRILEHICCNTFHYEKPPQAK